MRTVVAAVALGVMVLHTPGAGAAADGVIRVGSKSFTESYILAEIAAQVIEQTGEARVERRLDLGGTGITHRAITSGAIDLYPEYTGTSATSSWDPRPHVRSDRARLGASGSR
jgi:osmoprotectant transport system substrate-binding protein